METKAVIARSATVCGFDHFLRAEHHYQQDIAEKRLVTKDKKMFSKVKTDFVIVPLVEEDIQPCLHALK